MFPKRGLYVNKLILSPRDKFSFIFNTIKGTIIISTSQTFFLPWNSGCWCWWICGFSNNSEMCSSHQHPEDVFNACQLDRRHNPTLSEAGLSQSYQSSREPGVVGRRTNGGFHAHVSAGRKQFARHEWAQKAAYLLGCTLEELSSSIFKHQAKGTLPRGSAVRQASDENGTADAGTPQTTVTNWLFPLRSSQAPSLCLCHSRCVYDTHAHMRAPLLFTWGKLHALEKVKLILVMNTTALQKLLTDK